MRRVRSAAAAINTSGEPIVSQPALWCSPIYASSKPSTSSHWMISRSRSRARVGFSPGRWKGAMKMPNFILAGTVIVQFPSQSRRQQSTQYHLRSDVVLLELITQLAGRNAQQSGGAGLYTAATAQGLEQAFALDVSHSLGQGRGCGFGKEYPG